MSNKLNETQKLFRSSRLLKDNGDHNVLVDSAKTGTLQLMSVQMLRIAFKLEDDD